MQMIPQQFADMQAKGFHNSYRSPAIVQGLIVSEIVEGFEALRKGLKAPAYTVKAATAFLKDNDMGIQLAKDQYGCIYAGLHLFERMGIKDTIEAEMAGVCLRCFDAIGARLHEGDGVLVDTGINREDGFMLESLAAAAAMRISKCMEGVIRYYDAENAALFPEILVSAIPPAMGIQTAPSDYTAHGVAPYITELNSYVETLANMARIATYFGVDLLTHIELEVAYNRTREYQHGGRKY